MTSFIIKRRYILWFFQHLEIFFQSDTDKKKLTKVILLWGYKGRSIRFLKCKLVETIVMFAGWYRGVDKSFARPGRKQARKHVRDARDFNNIETRAVIKFFFFSARQGAEGNSRNSDRNISSVAYPGILFGGVQQIQLRTEDRERGSGGGSPLVRGTGGSCNLVKKFHFI